MDEEKKVLENAEELSDEELDDVAGGRSISRVFKVKNHKYVTKLPDLDKYKIPTSKKNNEN